LGRKSTVFSSMLAVIATAAGAVRASVLWFTKPPARNEWSSLSTLIEYTVSAAWSSTDATSTKRYPESMIDETTAKVSGSLNLVAIRLRSACQRSNRSKLCCSNQLAPVPRPGGKVDFT